MLWYNEEEEEKSNMNQTADNDNIVLDYTDLNNSDGNLFFLFQLKLKFTVQSRTLLVLIWQRTLVNIQICFHCQTSLALFYVNGTKHIICLHKHSLLLKNVSYFTKIPILQYIKIPTLKHPFAPQINGLVYMITASVMKELNVSWLKSYSLIL